MPSGRPKKYATDEERREAYRERKRVWHIECVPSLFLDPLFASTALTLVSQRHAVEVNRRKRDKRKTTTKLKSHNDPEYCSDIGTVSSITDHDMSVWFSFSKSKPLTIANRIYKTRSAIARFVIRNPTRPLLAVHEFLLGSIYYAAETYRAASPEEEVAFWAGKVVGLDSTIWVDFVANIMLGSKSAKELEDVREDVGGIASDLETIASHLLFVWRWAIITDPNDSRGTVTDVAELVMNVINALQMTREVYRGRRDGKTSLRRAVTSPSLGTSRILDTLERSALESLLFSRTRSCACALLR